MATTASALQYDSKHEVTVSADCRTINYAGKRETLKFHLSSGGCMFRDENTKCSGSNKTRTDHTVLLMYDNIHGH